MRRTTRSLIGASVLGALVIGMPTPTVFARPEGAGAAAADAAAEAAAADSARADAPASTPIAADASVDEPAPVLAASSGDIDLSSLGLDPSTTFDDKLSVYGFADVSYTAFHWTKPNAYFPQSQSGFAVGNFNIYVAKNAAPNVRALGEVRFTFMPAGTLQADGSFTDTAADDPANFWRPAKWGSIVIERLHIEYDLTSYLTIRAGHWLSPYGIWNTDHGSPTIIGTLRPYIIGEQFIPEHQTGLDLFGSRYTHGMKASYHVTVSNGRGPIEAIEDQDKDLALGVNLNVETPWGLKLGGSYYRGRFTALAKVAGGPRDTYRETVAAGDLQYDLGGLHVQAELLVRDRHYDDGVRAATAAGFAPDARDFGVYALAGYRFKKLWNVMPFGFIEDFYPSDHLLFEHAVVTTAGLNFRPSPGLVLKLLGMRATISEGEGLYGGRNFYSFSTQASWMF